MLYFIIMSEVMDFNYQFYLHSDITYICNCSLEVLNVIMAFEREMMALQMKATIYSF